MAKTFGYDVQELRMPEVDFDTQGTTVRRFFKLAWTNALDFAQSVLGSATGTAQTLPDKLANYGNIEAKTVTIRTFVNPEPAISKVTSNSTVDLTTEGDCEATVTYSTTDRTADTTSGETVADGSYTNPHNPGGPPILLEYSADESGEMMAIPGRFLRNAANQPLPADQYVGIFVPTTNHRIVIFDIDNLPPARRSLRGKVNNGSFEIPVANVIIPRGCGLYLGSSLSRKYTAANIQNRQEPAWTITYTIAERNVNDTYGWNHGYGKNGWQELKQADGTKPYTEGDFSGLFFF